MSLYNQLFGVNPLAAILMEILQLDKQDYPDFPEELASYSGEGEERKRYLNWNKGSYSWEDAAPEGYESARAEYLKTCQEHGVYVTGRFRDIYYDKKEGKIILYTRNGGGNREDYWYVFDLLRKHPNYISDYDDDFDCTYAYIAFSVPEEFKKALDDLVNESEIETISDKFNRIQKEMESMSSEQFKADPRFAGTVKILEDITATLNAQEGNTTKQI